MHLLKTPWRILWHFIWDLKTRYVAASVVTDRQTDRQNERLLYPSRMRRGLIIEGWSRDYVPSLHLFIEIQRCRDITCTLTLLSLFAYFLVLPSLLHPSIYAIVLEISLKKYISPCFNDKTWQCMHAWHISSDSQIVWMIVQCRTKLVLYSLWWTLCLHVQHWVILATVSGYVMHPPRCKSSVLIRIQLYILNLSSCRHGHIIGHCA